MMISTLQSTLLIAGPAHSPGIHEVHGAAVTGSRPRVSPSEIMVVAMSSIAAAVAISEWNGPSVACPNHWQSSKDGCDWQNVYDLLSGEGLVDQPRAALGDPRLCQIQSVRYMLLHIIAY